MSNRGVEECKNYNLFISVLIVMRERERLFAIYLLSGAYLSYV